MPFGQLIIGSPGAGKTTYCAGAQSFLDALGRPAQVVNLDPANLTAALPYAPVVDINSLITVTDVMRELELGPNVSAACFGEQRGGADACCRAHRAHCCIASSTSRPTWTGS